MLLAVSLLGTFGQKSKNIESKCDVIYFRIPAASISLLDPDKNLVWNYKTVPQEGSAQGFLNNRMTLPLGKVLGGSSSIGEWKV